MHRNLELTLNIISNSYIYDIRLKIMEEFAININGEVKTISAPGDTPLLWIIRDNLELNGTKYGCGKAFCGACTIHIDGVPSRSCIVPVSDVGTSEITTIEGISRDGLHPIQIAWIEEDVPQCGYCQSGQIMSAIALVSNKSNPSDSEIELAMAGNLCRCGTYVRIKKAIKRATLLQ